MAPEERRVPLTAAQIAHLEKVAAIRRQRVLETFQLDPLVKVMLKGKEYTLEFNNRAVKFIMKDTSLNLMSAGFGMDAMQDPEIMGALLFRGLQTHHPDLTQDEIDLLYSYRHFPYILQCLRQGLDLFLPDMSDVEAEEDQAGSQGELPLDPTRQPIPIG